MKSMDSGWENLKIQLALKGLRMHALGKSDRSSVFLVIICFREVIKTEICQHSSTHIFMTYDERVLNTKLHRSQASGVHPMRVSHGCILPEGASF